MKRRYYYPDVSLGSCSSERLSGSSKVTRLGNGVAGSKGYIFWLISQGYAPWPISLGEMVYSEEKVSALHLNVHQFQAKG